MRRPPSLGGLVHIGLDILSTAVNAVTNKITAQTGNAIKQSTDASGLEWWQHVGFASRAAAPVAGKAAAQGVVLKTSDRDAVVASQDLRGLDIYGNLGDGETCVYAAGKDGLAQARVMLRGDGSITLMTTDTNLKGGTAVSLMLAPDKVAFDAPWGSVLWDVSGLHLKDQSGARLDMGGMNIPGLPAALAGLMTSYVKFTAAKFSAKAAMVLLGPGPTYNTIVHAPAAAITAPPTPLMTGPTSQASAVRVSVP